MSVAQAVALPWRHSSTSCVSEVVRSTPGSGTVLSKLRFYQSSVRYGTVHKVPGVPGTGSTEKKRANGVDRALLLRGFQRLVDVQATVAEIAVDPLGMSDVLRRLILVEDGVWA